MALNHRKKFTGNFRRLLRSGKNKTCGTRSSYSTNSLTRGFERYGAVKLELLFKVPKHLIRDTQDVPKALPKVDLYAIDNSIAADEVIDHLSDRPL
jgi:hypothetical protein